GDGAVDPDRKHVVDRLEIGIGAVVQEEWPVAADAGGDHLAGLGMRADVARQRQERKGALVVDIFGRPALGQAGTLGVLALAALHIGAEAAGAQRDLLARIGIRAENLVAVHARVGAVLAAIFPELAGIAAFGIVGAADE